MSLFLTDAGGNDLQATPPAEVMLRTASRTLSVGVFCTITEDDTSLPFQFVAADLDWNDGSQPVHYGEEISPLTINTERTLGLGTYAIRVTAHNNRSPEKDTVEATFIVNVVPFKGVEEQPVHYFGPILPKDSGSPNAQS